MTTHLLHHMSGLGVAPASHAAKDGSKTLVQYSRDRSTYEMSGLEDVTQGLTDHLAWYIEHLAHILHVHPILLPIAAVVCAGLVTRIPVPHEYGREVVVLQDVQSEM